LLAFVAFYLIRVLLVSQPGTLPCFLTSNPAKFLLLPSKHHREQERREKGKGKRKGKRIYIS